MAKVTAPNLSMGSSGTVGKTLVNGSWRGVNYVRQYVMPANPKTAEQTKTRSVFAFLCAVYKTINAAVQAAWVLYAKGQSFTDRNAWISQNLTALRTATDLKGMVFSPGAKGGIVAHQMTIVPGTGSLSVTLTSPSLPTGWTITAAHVVAIKDGDPHTDNAVTTTAYGTATTSPFTVALTVAAGTYDVFGYFQFAKTDGSTAYGPSITDQGTAT